MKRARRVVALVLAGTALWVWWSVQIPGLRVDLAHAHFGPGLVHYLTVAGAGIAGLLLLAKCLPGNRVSHVLARTSLVVFPLHSLQLNFLSGITGMAGLPPLAQWEPWGTFLLLLVIFAAGVPLGLVMERRCPCLLGRAGPAVWRSTPLPGSLPSSTPSR